MRDGRCKIHQERKRCDPGGRLPVGYSGETGIGDTGTCQPGYDPPSNGFDHLHFEIRDGGLYQKDCVHPLLVLPYIDATAPQVAIKSMDVSDPSAPIVDVTVQLPPEELDLNRVEVIVYDDSGGSLVEVDRHAYDMIEWNWLARRKRPDPRNINISSLQMNLLKTSLISSGAIIMSYK